MRVISFIILFLLISINAFAVDFTFNKDTLYWNKNKGWLKLQLDHKNPPTINTEDISGIEDNGEDTLLIWVKNKLWILHYRGLPEKDWYVEDWFYNNSIH